MTPINSIPQIGDVLFYKNFNNEFSRRIVVDKPEGHRPLSDGIIWIQSDSGSIDIIIAEFTKGEFNNRLFKA